MNASILLTALIVVAPDMMHAADPHPFDRRPQPWVRRADPILSARTTKQDWCKIVCYSPHVIHHGGKFRMWYLGTSTASRSSDIVMGYAESNDGVQWKEHPHNPILTGKDVLWGRIIQTPFVMYDSDQRVYKMWFVSGDGIRRDDQGKVKSNDQRLGYATSADGIAWKVHPKPIYSSGRSPSVIKEGPQRYRMWMGSRPNDDSPWDAIYQNIYAFTSTDGIQWQRSAKPVIRPTGRARSTVYPFVVKQESSYVMWYGCHVDGGKFEIFCANSTDGTRWQVNHDQPAFPAAEGKTRFDSRYTSTPCIVRQPDRYLLYYSA
ncbi:MAG: hypothetical protein IH991_14365, partial [Planctomycetes bacterium]|nr:hypothetical protein [Planctomycetota bacterium]